MFNILPRQVTSTFSWCNHAKMHEWATYETKAFDLRSDSFVQFSRKFTRTDTYLGPWIEKCAKDCASSQEIWRTNITSPTGIDWAHMYRRMRYTNHSCDDDGMSRKMKTARTTDWLYEWHRSCLMSGNEESKHETKRESLSFNTFVHTLRRLLKQWQLWHGSRS